MVKRHPFQLKGRDDIIHLIRRNHSCSVEHVVRHFQVGQRFVPIVVQQLPITSPARRYREPNPPHHHSISPTTSLSLPTTRPSSLLNQGKPASHRQFMEDPPMTHQQPECHHPARQSILRRQRLLATHKQQALSIVTLFPPMLPATFPCVRPSM